MPGWVSLSTRRREAGAAPQGLAEPEANLGREGVKSFLLYGIQVLRTCAVVPYSGSDGLWEGPELDFVNKFNTLQLGHEVIGKMVKVLEDAMYSIERNGNPKIILMDASYGLVKSIMKKN